MNSIGLVGSQANAGAIGSTVISTTMSNTDVGVLITELLLEGPRRLSGAKVATRPASRNARRGRTRRGARPRNASRTGWSPIQSLFHVQRRLPGVQLAERHDTRNLPLLPLLVHLLLEISQVLLGEVSEAALLEQVFANRLARATLDDRLRLAVVLHDAVLDLVEREDPGLDGELAELVAQHRV